jgi:hypothetical protein
VKVDRLDFTGPRHARSAAGAKKAGVDPSRLGGLSPAKPRRTSRCRQAQGRLWVGMRAQAEPRRAAPPVKLLYMSPLDRTSSSAILGKTVLEYNHSGLSHRFERANDPWASPTPRSSGA